LDGAHHCPVTLLLYRFAIEVRDARAEGFRVEVVTAPYCDSFGTWRAECRRNGAPCPLVWRRTAGMWTRVHD
jgi:hypothetical protein